MTASDFTAKKDGSVFLLFSESPRAREWTQSNILGTEIMWDGFQPVVFSERHILDVVVRLKTEGFEVNVQPAFPQKETLPK